MKRWLRHLRSALIMGVIWAFGWACIGGAIELASNIGLHLPWFSLIDMWPQTLAIPGFFCGAAFSAVLRIAAGGGRRKFEELSVPTFGVWGALAGALAGGLLVGVLGIRFEVAAIITGVTTLLSAASGAGTLAIASMAGQRERLGAGAEDAGVRLSQGETE